MKIFHISDLHIGKHLNSYDLSEVQKDVLNQIIAATEHEKPNVIVIAGDIYDKSAPSGEAFQLLDEFFSALEAIKPQIPVFIISGNHDNRFRLNYAGGFLARHGIHIAAAPPQKEDEFLEKFILQDAYGDICFYLMPFVKPEDAKNLLGKEALIHTYDDAFAAILNRETIDYSKRNVLIAHQFFVSGEKQPEKRESELRYISVGGIDSVDICHVINFDYVALGHIHTSQHIGKPYIRYSGTPLKYSVSEANDDKSITVVTLKEKSCEPEIKFIPLNMKPDVKKLKGTLQEIISMSNEDLKKDYVSITLTDEEALFRPKDRLGDFFEKIIDVTIDNMRTKALMHNDVEAEAERTDHPLGLFCDFYQEMNGQPISEAERAVIAEVIEKLICNMQDKAQK